MVASANEAVIRYVRYLSTLLTVMKVNEFAILFRKCIVSTCSARFFLKIGFRDGQNIKLSFCIHVFFTLTTVKRADKSFGGVFTEMSPMWTDIKNAHNALHQHPVGGFRRLPVSLG